MRENFHDLLWFLAVAEERSFTRAADKIGVTQSTVSHAIKRLETQMGLRLLARTTRSVSTTEAGERLRQSLAPRIAEIETDIAALTADRDKPSGTVRITVSDHAVETAVWPSSSRSSPAIRTSRLSFVSTTVSATSWRTVSTRASGSASASRRT